jgi:hypothetical protein
MITSLMIKRRILILRTAVFLLIVSSCFQHMLFPVSLPGPLAAQTPGPRGYENISLEAKPNTVRSPQVEAKTDAETAAKKETEDAEMPPELVGAVVSATSVPSVGGRRPSSSSWLNRRNWMAYTTPYSEFFWTRHEKNDQPLGSLLLPVRIRTPELSAGRKGKIGFYTGADIGVRFQSEAARQRSMVKSHSMFSGVVGGYYSGLNNPFIYKVDVSFNSLGRGIALELTGKTLSQSAGKLSFVMIPKVQIYGVTPTSGGRGWIWNANLATHWMYKRAMISVTPGLVQLPDGKILLGGNLSFPLPKKFVAFLGVPTNVPMQYQDVLPGAHPKPGFIEFGVGKGPFQFGAGVGKEGVYGLFRISLKPQQIGNRELRPQGDGHIMLSPEAEASHHGHRPNASEIRTEVTVAQDVRVPPATLLELIQDPFFKNKEAHLQFDPNNSMWQIGFRHKHRMTMGGQMTTMTMPVNIEISDLLKFLHDSNDTNDSATEAIERIRGFYEARVREITHEIQEISEDQNISSDERIKRTEPLYKEGKRYGVLFEELDTAYRKVFLNRERLGAIVICQSSTECSRTTQ